jgi:hypothetical protein
VFWRLAPGVLVLGEEALLQCDDLYYSTVGGIELLSLRDGARVFKALNAVEFLPRPSSGAAPCLVDRHYMAVFCIEGQPETDIFTVSGHLTALSEFKSIYDHYGFQGLHFEPIWTGQP